MPGVKAGVRDGVRHGVRLEVNVDPGVPNPPGVSAGVRAGDRLVLMFCEKPEFRLCVMPEIIILVCSVVRVRPLLYTEEHSDLRARRSSRSLDTLKSNRNNNMTWIEATEKSNLLHFLQFFIGRSFILCTLGLDPHASRHFKKRKRRTIHSAAKKPTVSTMVTS